MKENFSPLLEKLLESKNLSLEEARRLFLRIMNGELSEVQISAVLTALRAKGESPEEIAGAALAMREKSIKVKVNEDLEVCDTCGTGGDGKGTYNVSTAVAIALSAGGAYVAKHGNRSISSRTGSADVLEVLGIPVNLGPDEASRELENKRFAFLFAPIYHPAMKHAMPVRKALGIRTVFNILGPLTNPAGAERQLIGVFDPHTAEKVFKASSHLPYRHLLVLHGEGGFDEASVCGPTHVWERKGAKERAFTVRPGELGFKTHPPEKLAVSSPEESAEVIFKIFSWSASTPHLEFFLLNAGLAAYASGLKESIEEGTAFMEEMLRTGAVLDKLHELRRGEA